MGIHGFGFSRFKLKHLSTLIGALEIETLNLILRCSRINTLSQLRIIIGLNQVGLPEKVDLSTRQVKAGSYISLPGFNQTCLYILYSFNTVAALLFKGSFLGL